MRVYLLLAIHVAACLAGEPRPSPSASEAKKAYDRKYHHDNKVRLNANRKIYRDNLSDDKKEEMKDKNRVFMARKRSEKKELQSSAVQVTPWGTTIDHEMLNAINEEREKTNARQSTTYQKKRLDRAHVDSENLKVQIRKMVKYDYMPSRDPTVDAANRAAMHAQKDAHVATYFAHGHASLEQLQQAADKTFANRCKKKHTASTSRSHS